MATDSTPVRTWLDRLDDLARAHPDLTALKVTGEAGGTLSWHDLTRRSAGASRLLSERGVRHGDTVCVQLPNGIAHILSSIAAWRLGATVVPMRWDLPAPERAHLIDLAKPALLICEAPVGAGELAGEAVLAAPAIDPAGLPPAPIAAPAWMIGSGGSTGKPKLIAPNVTTAMGRGGFGFSEGRSFFADNSDHRHPTHLICSPLYHTQAFSLLYRTLTEDFRVILMPKFETEAFLDLVEQEHATFFAIVPTMLIRLLRSPTVRQRDFSSVENAILGSAATPGWAIREWIELIGGKTLLMGYGMSEGIASAFIRGDEWLDHPGSVGRPLDVETLVADADGRALPAGELGELYFRPLKGAHSFKYVGKAEMRTLPGGWASVGDIGWLDADGYLYIADRRTDMIVSGGANIFVAEVEAALIGHPQVEDAVVIGLPDPEWGRRVHAIVQPRRGVDADVLRLALPGHCKQMLAAYKTPRSFEMVADLGRDEVGKINRQALARAREEEPA